MHELMAIHRIAVEQTKSKIFQDINHLIGNREVCPDFQSFVKERKTFLSQIWINVWLNKVTNDMSKQEKRTILKNCGYVTEGLDKKLINKLFRDEMRIYQPFDAEEWLYEKYGKNPKAWEERFKKAREVFCLEEEKKQNKERIRGIEDRILAVGERHLEKHGQILYLYVRNYVSKQLTGDLQNNPRYQEGIDKFALEEKLVENGTFHAGDFGTVGDFFEELTGGIRKTMDWGRSIYRYETYFDRYGMIVGEYVFNLITEKISDQLPQSLSLEFFHAHRQKLDKFTLQNILTDSINDFSNRCMDHLSEEDLSDVLRVATVKFDERTHQEIYEEDLANREKRREEELAEQERKRVEEARMMDDIFGYEYRPSFNREVKYVLHIGETNTGKTHHALQRMKEAESGLYLAPLRLLALEVYDKLNDEGVPCSLKTGEEEKTEAGARHISCTVEMFYEKDFYDVLVIDEAQMLADKDRGFSWYKAITKANANEVHIIGSRNIKELLLQIVSESQIEVNEYRREIPLEVESTPFEIKHTKKGDALVCFSRKQVLETAARVQNSGHAVSMIYGSMPPETRKKQIHQFIQGKTKVIVATDAIGMGLNLPIRRVVFLANEKFDGTRKRRLTSQEIKQIAGRAGRKGMYNVGKVAFTGDIKLMKELLNQDDRAVSTFTIAPTNSVFERFQKYHRSLEIFFEFWEKFEGPTGTKKATLSEERELYELIKGTEIEARLSMMDLYGFLHLPFSTKEQALISQWQETVKAIVRGDELPEPSIKNRDLEDMELSYKAIGLHLLFLYRLGKQTEAIYWERLRADISDGVHEQLNSEVKNYKKTCRHCGKKLSWETPFQICESCHSSKYRRSYFHR